MPTIFLLQHFLSCNSHSKTSRREEAQLKHRLEKYTYMMLSHPRLLSHVRTPKTSKGHLTHNTSKRPCMSRTIKYVCVLLQNPPEKLVSHGLCPRQAAAQAHCGLPCGLRHAQAGTKLKVRVGEQHVASPRRNTNQNIISYNLSLCLCWASERPAPSLLETLPAILSVPCPHPVVPHTSLLPAREIRDANRAGCFPLRPQQHST